MQLFVEGGFAMVFVVVFGGVALASSGRFALHPAPGGARAIVGYGAAVAFASLAGLAIDLAAVARAVAGRPDLVEEMGMATMVLVGVAEALAPVILGSAVLAVVSLLTAIGARRLPV